MVLWHQGLGTAEVRRQSLGSSDLAGVIPQFQFLLWDTFLCLVTSIASTEQESDPKRSTLNPEQRGTGTFSRCVPSQAPGLIPGGLFHPQSLKRPFVGFSMGIRRPHSPSW